MLESIKHYPRFIKNTHLQPGHNANMAKSNKPKHTGKKNEQIIWTDLASYKVTDTKLPNSRAQ